MQNLEEVERTARAVQHRALEIDQETDGRDAEHLQLIADLAAAVAALARATRDGARSGR